MNKKIIKIVSSLLIILTIFTFSVVLASDDTVYVWSSEAEPLSTQTSATTQSNTIQTNSNMLKNEINISGRPTKRPHWKRPSACRSSASGPWSA